MDERHSQDERFGEFPRDLADGIAVPNDHPAVVPMRPVIYPPKVQLRIGGKNGLFFTFYGGQPNILIRTIHRLIGIRWKILD